MAKIRGVFISTHNTAEDVTIEASLESYYKLLDCSTIDIVTRRIGGEAFDIICDDEGLFTETPVVTMCSAPFVPSLVGSLFICKHDGRGREQSLTDEQVQKVMDNFICGMLYGK